MKGIYEGIKKWMFKIAEQLTPERLDIIIEILKEINELIRK